MKFFIYIVIAILAALSLYSTFRVEPVTEKEAIEIASLRLSGGPDLARKERMSASLNDGKYVITFVKTFPGGDAIRRGVTVDQKTGKVLHSTADE